MKLLFVSTYLINSLGICVPTLNVGLTADIPGENTANQKGQHLSIYGYEMSSSATQRRPRVVTDYGLDGRGWITARDRDFSLFHTVHIDSENHSSSYPMRNGVTLLGGKIAGA